VSTCYTKFIKSIVLLVIFAPQLTCKNRFDSLATDAIVVWHFASSHLRQSISQGSVLVREVSFPFSKKNIFMLDRMRTVCGGKAEARIVLLGAFQVSAINQGGALRWSWVENRTFQLKGGHITAALSPQCFGSWNAISVSTRILFLNLAILLLT